MAVQNVPIDVETSVMRLNHLSHCAPVSGPRDLGLAAGAGLRVHLGPSEVVVGALERFFHVTRASVSPRLSGVRGAAAAPVHVVAITVTRCSTSVPALLNTRSTYRSFCLSRRFLLSRLQFRPGPAADAMFSCSRHRRPRLRLMFFGRPLVAGSAERVNASGSSPL